LNASRLCFAAVLFLFSIHHGGAQDKGASSWPQWRVPNRDGQMQGPAWPDRLTKDSLKLLWRVPLGPSYSGPIVSEGLVFTTETRNMESEVVLALDRGFADRPEGENRRHRTHLHRRPRPKDGGRP
jgi:hypothetical protein